MRRAISYLLMFALAIAAPVMIAGRAECSSIQAAPATCCSPSCPASRAPRSVDCCSFSSGAPHTRALSSTPSPTIDLPAFAWPGTIRTTVPPRPAARFGGFVGVGANPLSLFCSRQI